MTRIVLIQAAPTHWDAEGRLSGTDSLPLTEEAEGSIRALAESLDGSPDGVYRCARNEATDSAARIVAQVHRLRPRDNEMLDELGVGLWGGLLSHQIKARFPSAYQRWQENPLGVNPPEGEPLHHAIDRLRSALRKMFRRNRGRTLVLALRPMAMQIVSGLLRGEPPEQIGTHLHNRRPVETIELGDEELDRLLG